MSLENPGVGVAQRRRWGRGLRRRRPVHGGRRLDPMTLTPVDPAFNVAHWSRLLASEVAVGLALLAIIVFIAAFTP